MPRPTQVDLKAHIASLKQKRESFRRAARGTPRSDAGVVAQATAGDLEVVASALLATMEALEVTRAELDDVRKGQVA